VPLVEKLLVVASRALRKAREFQGFSGKTHCHVFPDGESRRCARCVLIPVLLCLYTAEALDPLIEHALFLVNGDVEASRISKSDRS